jgi:hypothetical protein
MAEDVLIVAARFYKDVSCGKKRAECMPLAQSADIDSFDTLVTMIS